VASNPGVGSLAEASTALRSTELDRFGGVMQTSKALLAALALRDAHPEVISHHLHLANVEIQLGELPAADLTLTAALRNFPGDRALCRVWANLPLLWSRRDLARARWEELRAANPDWTECDVNVAQFYRAHLRYHDALNALRWAIARSGAKPELILLLCDLMQEAGMADEAAAEAIRFFAASTFPISPQWLELFRRLLEDLNDVRLFRGIIQILLREDVTATTQIGEFLIDIGASSRDRLTRLLSAMSDIETDTGSGRMHRNAVAMWRDRIGVAPDEPLESPSILSRVQARLRQRAQPKKDGVAPLLVPNDAGYSAFRLDRPINEATSDTEEQRCDFFRLLRRLNRFVGDRRVRFFQYVLWAEGRFPLTSPFCPSDHHFLGCLYFEVRKSVAYGFQGPRGRVWLLTSAAGDAYRIATVFDESARRLFILDANSVGNFEHHQVQRILALTGRVFRDDGSPPAKVAVVSGHLNFAHYMWNEVTALLYLLQVPARSVSRVMVVGEPFGPFDQLLPWPAGIPIERTCEHSVMGDAGHLYHDYLLVPGSLIVSVEVKQRIREIVASCLQPSSALRRPFSARRLLWLSLRLMYRHATNEKEMAVALAERLARELPDWDIALDGFSLPWDVAFPGRFQLQYMRNLHERTVQLGASVTKAIRAVVGERLTVYDWTSASLPEALQLAGYANFYICHHGTQQHKIAWLYDTPGLIHANVVMNSNGVNGEWPQMQADSTERPDYVPGTFIIDADTLNERQDIAPFRDYSFSDIEGLIDHIVRRMRDL
jgi:hypothetical protein